MSKEKQEDLSERTLKSREQVNRLITQGKIEEAIEILERREKEEGIEELRWRITESRCRNVRGEYEQVIEIMDEITKEINEIKEPVEEKGEKERIRIDILNEQIWALLLLGQLDEGLEKVEEGIRLIEELEGLEEKDKERKANLLINKGSIFLTKGKLEQAPEYFEKSLIMAEELGNKQLIALSLHKTGIISVYKGELRQALEYFEKSLAIREEMGNNYEIARSLSIIGLIYQMKGELDQALKYYEKSREVSEEVKNKFEIANSLISVGIICHLKGELRQALEYYEKSLVMGEKMGHKHLIAESLLHVGSLHRELGALKTALDYLKQCLALYEEISNKPYVAFSLSHLISVSLDLEEIQQAKDYLNDFQQINVQEENKIVEIYYKLAEALVLKKSKRRKDLTKAEEILEEIVRNSEEEMIEHKLTVQALIILSELLLEELRLTSEEDILEEVEEKIEKISEIAKEQQSYSLLAESYWLKAQLALVRLDINEARNLLSQAQAIAEEKGLQILARKISSEHDHLLEQLDRWEDLITKDASITERVKVANLEELVGWMARKREIIIDEKEDEPIMILLVSKSGLPIYSKQFSQTEEMQDMLISGFLTSINAFVKEAFHVTGMIKRIMHDDYTLSFDLIEPILFCYVYEGQSYTAMKKLERLMTEVQTSEMWSALEEVGKKGYGLNKREKDQMEGVIGEIFITN